LSKSLHSLKSLVFLYNGDHTPVGRIRNGADRTPGPVTSTKWVSSNHGYIAFSGVYMIKNMTEKSVSAASLAAGLL
jgi:hypothetical protein